jgi:hypothetical protein
MFAKLIFKKSKIFFKVIQIHPSPNRMLAVAMLIQSPSALAFVALH